MGRDVTAADATELAEQLGGRLRGVASPLEPCLSDGRNSACTSALANLRNPYFIEDEPGAYHTTGWLDAYESRHSAYVVAAETAADIVAAVRFAGDRDIRLAIKGTGHDYLGRSSDPGSLLVWTHGMREISIHDAFSPRGENGPGVPAVTVGAGTRWLEVYQALDKQGRYVQGGGCTTVGAAGGFVQGGGFGSFSRHFGTAAGNVLEIEVVTAGGEVVVANPSNHPDLFWALRGGGGGTFGVVTKVTMRTHPLPETLGAVAGTIRASGPRSFRLLVGKLVELFPKLCDEHWGEQIRLGEDNSAEFSLVAVNMSDEETQALWQPFLGWVKGSPDDYTSDVFVVTIPFGSFWDAHARDELAPDMICHDDRPGQPGDRFWWAANQNEVSWYINAYQSRWLPRQLFDEAPEVLAEALFEATRHWHVGIHLNKGLSGAAREALERDRTTSINPAAFEAAALVIAASSQQEAFPSVPGLQPDPRLGRARAHQVSRAMEIIRDATPGAGSYVNETDYFEPDWQHSLWGENFARLLAIKQRYDPTNLFSVHHGVGSEGMGQPDPRQRRSM